MTTLPKYRDTVETTKSFIKSYTEGYCEAITENYKLDSIRTYKRMLEKDSEDTYAADRLNDIQNGKANLMKFEIREGRKYYKIVQVEFDTFQGRNEFRNGSVHCFIDKKTGEVYKAASWQNPAKHVRFDMRIIKDREFLHNPDNIDWAGGHLYMI